MVVILMILVMVVMIMVWWFRSGLANMKLKNLDAAKAAFEEALNLHQTQTRMKNLSKVSGVTMHACM